MGVNNDFSFSCSTFLAELTFSASASSTLFCLSFSLTDFLSYKTQNIPHQYKDDLAKTLKKFISLSTPLEYRKNIHCRCFVEYPIIGLATSLQ